MPSLRSFLRILSAAPLLLFMAGGLPAVAQEAQEEDDERPIVKSILVEGNERYSADQLQAAFGQRVGEPLLDEEAIERGIDFLFRNFRVKATMYWRPLGQRLEDGAEIRLVVEELPFDLEPRFIGNVEIDADELLEWAGLVGEEELYLYQTSRVRERLLTRYQQEGFYFVEVAVVERPGGLDRETGEERAPDVIFEIKEGPKVKVRDVKVHGNDTFPEQGVLFFKRGIRKLAQTELRGPLFFNWFSKKLVTETLDADIVAIREVYRDFGYLDAVVEVKRLDFSRNREWVTVHIVVDEGGRYTIGSMTIEALERFEDPNSPRGYGERPLELQVSQEELIELCAQQVGDIYERRRQKEDERALRNRYGEMGHIDHPTLPVWDRWTFLEPQLVFEAERPVVHVTYRIAQGRQIFIREIPITGNLHTQDRVIRRLIEVAPGQIADPTKIERSRSRIQGTGFFSDSRDVAHREPTYRFIDTDDPSWKDLEFMVEEGQVLTFNLSGGVSSNAGAFGLISLSQRNFDISNPPSPPWNAIDEIASREAFHGAGQEFRIEASPGTEVSRFNILFREPDIFRRHRDRIGLTLSARRTLRIFSYYDEQRDDYGFQFSRQLGLDSSVYAGYTYQTVDVDDIDTTGEPTLGNPLQVPRDLKDQEGDNNLSYVDVGYRLRRIDNRISPRNGLNFSFDNKIYAEPYGSDFEFVKQEVRFDWYDEFDEDPDLVSDRYHIGIGAGVAWPYGDDDSVPYTERFFLGGQRTLRGFAFRGVGPNQNGDPIGGQSMIYGTVEYRRPLVKQVQPGTYREIEQIQGGLFFDIGVLDPDDFDIDFDEVRMSWGVLFGISVPIPITFSFGWPLREGDDDSTRVLGFSIGL